ncbi:MAG: hypothetical protein V4503_12315 [Gemmatimonadota bacterium]
MPPPLKPLLVILPSLLAVPSIGAQQVPHATAIVDLEIGGAANHLLGVDWISVQPDQSIALLQFENAVLRYFDAEGKPNGQVRIAPRSSARINAVGTLGDTIWVHDASVPELTLISPSHRIVRRVSTATAIVLPSGEVSPFAPPLGLMAPRPVGLGASGQLLLWAPRIPARVSPPELHQPPNGSFAVVQVASNGVLRRVLAWIEHDPQCDVRTATASTSLPFCGRQLTAVSSDGRLVASVSPVLAGPDSATFGVLVVNSTGDTVYSRRHPFTARAVSTSEADKALERTTARFHRTSDYGMINAIEAAFHPTVHPPFESLLIATDGSLWIERTLPTAGPSWLVLDPKGDLARIVSVPPGLRPRAIANGHIWATRRDGLDLESVVRLHIE